MIKTNAIDLSQRIIPGKEFNFPCSVDLKDANESMPGLAYDPDAWYKIGYCSLCTHNGTHMEAPYHIIKDGYDVADVPLFRMMGNAFVMDFSFKGLTDPITLEDVKKYEGQIHEGDFLIVRTGADWTFRSDKWEAYPPLNVDAIEWIVAQKPCVLATDASGLEDDNLYGEPGHHVLLGAGIPLIESVTNLAKIENGKYFAMAMPMPLEGSDAIPVRVVAIEKSELIAELSK